MDPIKSFHLQIFYPSPRSITECRGRQRSKLLGQLPWIWLSSESPEDTVAVCAFQGAVRPFGPGTPEVGTHATNR